MNWQSVVHPVSIDLTLPSVVAPIIVLIGPPGVGKTTVGEALAEQLGYQFFDADALIESGTGKTIPQIFELYGEAEFRRIESEILERLVQAKSARTEFDGSMLVRKTEVFLTPPKVPPTGPQGTVIATGAGMPVNPGNLDRLASLGYLVYLTAPLKVLVSRLADSQNRPLLNSGMEKHDMSSMKKVTIDDSGQSKNVGLRLQEILIKRQKIYEQAEFLVDTGELSVSDVVRRIVDLLVGKSEPNC